MNAALERYRRAVRGAVPCPYCGSAVDARCVETLEIASNAVMLSGHTTQEVHYVHDDRSQAYQVFRDRRVVRR